MLSVEGVDVVYTRGHGRRRLHAVREVSFDVKPGEIVGLVGESGCGKSSIASVIAGLVAPSAGAVRLDGECIAGGVTGAKRWSREVQMVFQDPFSSLNPRMTVGAAIGEVLDVHRLARGRGGREQRLVELLNDVGLDVSHAGRFPHELSGGQRQRIGIARALAAEPKFLIADEPVAALDVSVQVHVLNLLRDIRRRYGIAILFIAHDLGTVRYLCDRMLVMYLGRIVERGGTAQLFARPQHPYTEALLAAVPDMIRSLEGGAETCLLRGEVPSAFASIPGCPFHTRCHRVRDRCREAMPEMETLDDAHASACFFARDMPTVRAGSA